jgi:hypothetical protein
MSVENDGLYMAFAGGTGILTFMDLVAHIAKIVLMNNVKSRTSINPDTTDFEEKGKIRLILFASFVNEETSIGLQLCRLLHDFCESRGLDNFKLVLRLSSNKGPRWDAKWIGKQFENVSVKDLKKAWVCGPPPMTETFDKTFEDLLLAGHQGL